MGRKWYADPQTWANVLALVSFVGVALFREVGVTGEVPPAWAEYVAILLPVITLILRQFIGKPGTLINGPVARAMRRE